LVEFDRFCQILANFVIFSQILRVFFDNILFVARSNMPFVLEIIARQLLLSGMVFLIGVNFLQIVGAHGPYTSPPSPPLPSP